ncbi:MAG: tRNA(adenine34) deaminase [Solirubrobacterales bacterium]|jgi:tRNA(adenine34) deaminase|nr:tRNA(adenine34) deaminase [Solirubrobacterales bacterium]
MNEGFSERDSELMQLALSEAERAAQFGDVPIGAVIASEGHALAFAGNERERRNDPTAHAEMLVLQAAASGRGGWRLPATTLYVTLEPCAMCAGAIVLARVPRVVYATADPKAGAAGSVFDILSDTRLNHRPKVESGLLGDEASTLLKDFFAERRG